VWALSPCFWCDVEPSLFPGPSPPYSCLLLCRFALRLTFFPYPRLGPSISLFRFSVRTVLSFSRYPMLASHTPRAFPVFFLHSPRPRGSPNFGIDCLVFCVFLSKVGPFSTPLKPFLPQHGAHKNSSLRLFFDGASSVAIRPSPRMRPDSFLSYLDLFLTELRSLFGCYCPSHCIPPLPILMLGQNSQKVPPNADVEYPIAPFVPWCPSSSVLPSLLLSVWWFRLVTVFPLDSPWAVRLKSVISFVPYSPPVFVLFVPVPP